MAVFASALFLAGGASWAQQEAPGPGPTHVPPGHIPTPPTQPPYQPPVDTGAARRDGYRDGQSDGQREGITRGPIEGDRAGREEGYRNGFNRCEREERERNFDLGYREGFNQGEREGAINGENQGEREGSSRGLSDGENDGTHRADQDANAAAAPLGRAQGIDEANHSDATARGQKDGLIAGDRDALEKARTEDYARGRQDFRDERYAEPVSSTDEFPQRQQAFGQVGTFARVWNSFKNFMTGTQAVGEGVVSISSINMPDRRFYSPNCRYNTPEENNACRGGYDDGYNSGFDSSYDRAYRETYDRAFRLGQDDGCRRARAGDYRGDYRRGFDNGRTEGYDRAYKAAYDNAYREMYARKFREASDQAYSQNYNRFYNQHFEAARAQAYSERVGALYAAAFDRAHDAKFAEVYPKYAAQEYKRGRADETEDFRLRPVRLVSAEVVETIPNGVYEPGELIRVKIQLRNFADAAVVGKDVRVTLTADGNDVAVIPEGQVLLSQGLKAKSVTTVTEVVEFRLTESHVGESSHLQLGVTFQGRKAGDEDFALTARYMIAVGFAEKPVLHEGMEGELKIRVKNISQAPSDAGLRIHLTSGSDAIEITNGQATVGLLNPGEERIVTFGAIARTGGHPEIRFAIEVNENAGRRVGLLDRLQEIPILNDYTVELSKNLSGLKDAGVFRAEYVLKNVSSRVLMKSLQLFVKVQTADGKDAASFAVLGPNPQFLTPLMSGQSTRFVIPILVKNQNAGGVVELEVKESGRTVVVHRAEF